MAKQPGMRIIDFRLRPPAKGFLDMVMYTDIERTARMAAAARDDHFPSWHRRCGIFLPTQAATRHLRDNMKRKS